MSQFLEQEIQTLLSEYQDTAVVADRLMQMIESEPSHLAHLETTESFARFLLNCGFQRTLRDFCARHLSDESFACPWAFFVESMALLNNEITESTRRSFEKAIRELGLQKELSRAPHGDLALPEVRDYRNERAERIGKEIQQQKADLLERLRTFRVQRLLEKEKELLARLQKMFPQDPQVLKESEIHRHHYALEIISKYSMRSRKNQISHEQKHFQAETSSAQSVLAEDLPLLASEYPSMAYDLAIAAFSLEAYGLGLEILEHADPDANALWLRMELLLKEKRYLELLSELTQMEQQLSHDAETFFATAYLRAQALWGLGQRNSAIEVMEGLLTARPQYRSGVTLLEVWRNQ